MTNYDYLMQARKKKKKTDQLLDTFLDLNDRLNQKLNKRKIVNILGTEDLKTWSRDVLKLNEAIKELRDEILDIDKVLECAWVRIESIEDEDEEVRRLMEDFFFYGKGSGEISELEGYGNLEILRMLEKGMMLIESSVSDKESDE